MKRFLAWLLTLSAFLMLSGCGANNIDKNAVETAQKSGSEILREYVCANGANYQGVYKIIHLDTNTVTSISCTQNGAISFYYSHEGDNSDTVTKIDLYEDSVTQTVDFEYTLDGYRLTATGTLFTETVSYDECSLYGISYTENFPSSVSKSTLDRVAKELFPASAKAMLAGVNLMIKNNVGIELNDLGFVSW